MRRLIATVSAALVLVIGASPAWAEPEIVKWLKDPCVPTGDMENSCQLP